jgi:uncharacterized membrane protein
MAPSSTVAAHSSQDRFKYFLFSVLGLMFLFVLWHNERFIVDHSHPAWAYFFPVRWWLLPHGLGGLTALLIGPFQFSSRFRQQHLRIHRIIGRLYLGAIAVSAPMGMYLTSIHNSLIIRFYVLTLGSAWLLSAGIAFVCVLNGNIPLHRQWMVRSYTVTTVFLTNRVFFAIPAIDQAMSRPGGIVVHSGVEWSILVATLVLTELGLAWPGIFANRRSQDARAQIAVAPRPSS